ncbi:Helix-turn-helix domain protein [Mucisphaera calidilacus]|uniref:Helix-turn-helix domain protein n=1 Tax=Mucisphaera calidilacus TaxID=2527982 RepID=A0A518C1D3_9BACT|nr:Helix-turn-helix domain protein [Mucisphaera calidilacus]
MDELDERFDTALFKALADPTRCRLLTCLIRCGRPCSVTEVAACCAVDFSVVARHLAQLARVGVLSAHKRGRTVWYEPRYGHLSGVLRGLADAVEGWCPGGGGVVDVTVETRTEEGKAT